MKIVCAGHLVRHPVAGHVWHHGQYVAGLRRLGHDVMYIEDWGWDHSCYDPVDDVMTDDPSRGLAIITSFFASIGAGVVSYLAADGSSHGIDRDAVADAFRDADLYLNLSNMNSIPEAANCRRRALVDTDPVFTQLRLHGLEDPETYDVRFTYGENIGRAGCEIPADGLVWLPTRQPIVLDLWQVEPVDANAPLTTLTNWAAYDAAVGPDGRWYGQKDVEFERYLDLPQDLRRPMEMALNAGPEIFDRLRRGGWSVVSPLDVADAPRSYQAYLRRSAGEFSVAKHAYVSTQSGWFSDRTAGYLASGRPAVIQDTGFSSLLPVGEGLLAFRSRQEAIAAILRLDEDLEYHASAARTIAESAFDASAVLEKLLTEAT